VNNKYIFIMGRSGSQLENKRFLCPVSGCDHFNKNKDEIKSTHLSVCKFAGVEGWTEQDWKAKKINALTTDEQKAWRKGEFKLRYPQYKRPVVDDSSDSTMESTAGRGQREKKPSEKIKELHGKKPDTPAEDPNRAYPPVYTADHVAISADVKEIEKIYQHTKITETGEKYEFYSLGNQ
jgi:hypothetical protein